MTRIALVLSAMMLSAAVATPALAKVQDVAHPGCGGGDEKKDEKKPTSFARGDADHPSCGGGGEKKDEKKPTSFLPA
jgi:hypothetical protein